MPKTVEILMATVSDIQVSEYFESEGPVMCRSNLFH